MTALTIFALLIMSVLTADLRVDVARTTLVASGKREHAVNDHQRKMARKTGRPAGYRPDGGSHVLLADAGGLEQQGKYNDWRLGPTQLEEIPPQAPALSQEQIDAHVKRSPGYWKKTWQGATKYETVNVDKGIPWDDVRGFVSCNKERRECMVLMRSQTRDYDAVHEHERMHVMGYDHPDYRHSLGRPLPSILERPR